MSSVNVHDLLSACCDAADRAGTVIRSVHRERLAGGSTTLGATKKDESCDRSWATVADTRAQTVIVAALQRDFPGIEIIGEEDIPSASTASAFACEEDKSLAAEKLHLDHPAAVKITPPPRHETVPLDTITIFVDPVDGTKEYVEGRVENVCCLIGISIRGEAVGGVIGLPFWQEDKGKQELVVFDGTDAAVTTSAVLCGIVDGKGGVGGLPEGDTTRTAAILVKENRRSLRLAASAEGSAGSPVSCARDALCESTTFSDSNGNFELISTPGAGNKIVSVLMGRSDAALLNLKGSLWDTCATEAVLVAAGGRVTDYFNGRFFHSRKNPLGMSNKLGAIATAKGVDHLAMCSRLSATPEVVALLASTGLRAFAPLDDHTASKTIASDIARTIQGAPLTAEGLTTAIGGSHPPVRHFAAPDASSVRYKMAECCRLWLEYEGDEPGQPPKGPRSVFIKRSVMRDLTHARAKITSAPHKLARDVRSYAVETSFLRSEACARLAASPSVRTTGTDATPTPTTGVVRLARALGGECHVDHDSLIDSSFCVLLDDFCHLDGWKQPGMLTFKELQTAVGSLAKLHAFFWNGRVGTITPDTTDAEERKVLDEMEKSVWDSGCYWSPKRQAPDQIEKLNERFEKHGYAAGFASYVEKRNGPSVEALKTVSERLTKVAPSVAKASHLYLADNDGAFENASGCGRDAVSGAETQSDRSRTHPQRTLVHGDLKAANLFFRTKVEGATYDEGAEIEAGFIDYQWSGWGLGAVDLAYMMCAAAGPTALDLTKNAEAETALLRHYHNSLCEALAAFGAASSPAEAASKCQSFETLQSQYEDALLDHSVTVFAYLWNELKASPEVLIQRGKKFPITANAVNKSPECAAWLLGRCSMLLDKKEVQ